MNRNGGGLVYAQDDALLNVLLETLGFNLQFVVADWQFQQDICTGMICGCRAREARLGLPGGNAGSLHDGAAGVFDRSANASRNLLSESVHAGQQND